MTKTQISKAKQYLKQLELHTQKKENWVSFKYSEIINDNLYYNELSKIIHDHKGDEYTAYMQMYECLNWLVDEEPENPEDEMHEVVDSMVTVYTSSLTEWLARSDYNVYWLSEAIQEGADDGFQALQMAQYKAYESIWLQAVNLIV